MTHKRSRKDINILLSQIKSALNNFYGKNLVELILYGSFARDEATEDSDIDIAVVLIDEVDQFQEIERINELTYPLVLEKGELVSFYPISTEELKDREWPLHYHIQEEGITI
ncbi:MAG: hypothetical protein BME94_03495 [Methanobacteriales archaeon Met13]